MGFDRIEEIGNCARCNNPATNMYRHEGLFFGGYWFYCDKHILDIKADLRVRYRRGW